MQINITYDASVSSAPAGFKTAVDAAVQYLESVFTAPITVNINVGWGEVGGQSLNGALGASIVSRGIDLSYSELRNALWSNARTPDGLAAAMALPAADPTNGGDFFITSAEAKALGLVPDDNLSDGAIGLDSSTQYTFDPNNRAVAGQVDAIGTIEHEITEVLGRGSFLGFQPGDGTTLFGVIDLFRYSAPGVLAPTSGNGSFSINGQTLLIPFDNPSNTGDSGDWSQTIHGDAFDAFGDVGVADLISTTDLRLMDVLGYHPVPVMPNTPTPNVAPSQTTNVTQDLQIAQGQTYFVTDDPGRNFDWVFTQNDGATITNSGTIAAIGSEFFIEGVVGFNNYSSPFINSSTGSVYAKATGNGSEAYGVDGCPSVDNSGLIQVMSTQGPATGALIANGTQFNNHGTGTVVIWADTTGIGVKTPVNFTNSGLIDVTAADAIGVQYPFTLNNSGTIRATNNGDHRGSIAVELGGGTGQATNSGMIQADFAFLNENDSLYSYSLTNSGTVIGKSFFADGDAQVHNTGTIGGSLFFGDSTNLYDGANGKLYGAIYLQIGADTINLGTDAGIVYCGGGVGTITGNAGNDFFEITRGAYTIDGGAGFNTLSFANADMGVTVDLGAGTAFAGGNETISNIQQVIGSGYDDTLKAGASATTLVAGAGHDTLVGGAAGDTLIAGSGGDTMTGNGGNDTFVYSAGDHHLVITDFGANGNQDVLKIYGYASAISVQQQGADTLITLSTNDTVLLKNVLVGSITSTNVKYNAAPYPGPLVPASAPAFGTSTIFVDQNLRIYTGETINETAQPTGLYNRGYSLDNFGTINVSYATASPDDYVWGWLDSDNDKHGQQLLPSGPYYTWGVNNEAGASINVVNPIGNAIGIFLSGHTATNAGTISVNAAGRAEAIEIDAFDPSFTNAATGSINVSGGGDAFGLDLTNGITFLNAGSFNITGGARAFGIRMDRAENHSITNTGTMTVSAGPSGHSYGIAVTGLDLWGVLPPGDTGYCTISNSGTITASDAIYVYDGGYSPKEYPIVHVSNSGTINGNITLRWGPNQIQNTGSIVGVVRFDDGDAVFNGAGGALSGALYLGCGNNTVTLGNDGEVVYGSEKGGSDAITGGPGNDFIGIGHGNNTIDGGGGFNTLSFSFAVTGVSVDLVGGTAFAGGTDTIHNIQEVIGSNFDDTLTAGAAAVTFIGGGGHDTLVGGAGNDTLVASSNGSTMTGNGGNDTFIFSTGDHQLVVTDFGANGDQDALKIYGYTSAQSVQQQGVDTLIKLSNSDSVLLKNVQTSSLSGNNLVYNASAYTPPSVSSPAPSPMGTSTIDFFSDITIYAGEHISVTGAIGLKDDSNLSSDTSRRMHSVDNAGVISVGSPSGDVTGFYVAPYVDRFDIYTMRNFTNEAGATFNVSAPGGSGTGYWTGQFAQDFTNAGNYTVNSSGAAYGILSWESAAYYSLVNTSTGLFTVTSSTGAAYGFDLVYGGNLQNDGTINVTGATDVFAIATQGGSVTNTGAITATGNSPGAQTYGIRIDQSYVAITVMNSGTITAKTAITSPIYDPYSEGESLSLTNTGTINGDIDLGVANHDSIVNTGTINGNFFVHGGFVTIDLRAGTFTGSISIAPALDAYARDTIYTGSGNTLIKITGGDTALQATITGGVGGNTTVQYDIASSAALLTHNVDGSWTVSAGSDGVETLTNVQSLIFTDETVMLSAATPSPRADFNGDGKSDFLMQSDYGRAGIWLMNGTTATSSGPINPNPGTTWHAKAGADFNGDGNADVLWQNADGSIAMWFMNGTTIANAALVPINPGPSWQIVGSGDFNGDGKADILFRSTDGTPAIWLMNGNNIVSGALPGPNPGTSWRFVGSGDFNGDGKSDILWQNVTDGTPAIWLMNGGSILAGAALNDPGTTWNLKAAGDFNGDGKSDLLWQNVDGTPAIWLMNGTTVVSGALAGFNPGTTWQAVGTGDFNGDGKADILWQNTDGTPAIWIMNGTSVASGAALANPGSQWHAIAMGG